LPVALCPVLPQLLGILPSPGRAAGEPEQEPPSLPPPPPCKQHCDKGSVPTPHTCSRDAPAQGLQQVVFPLSEVSARSDSTRPPDGGTRCHRDTCDGQRGSVRPSRRTCTPGRSPTGPAPTSTYVKTQTPTLGKTGPGRAYVTGRSQHGRRGRKNKSHLLFLGTAIPGRPSSVPAPLRTGNGGGRGRGAAPGKFEPGCEPGGGGGGGRRTGTANPDGRTGHQTRSPPFARVPGNLNPNGAGECLWWRWRRGDRSPWATRKGRAREAKLKLPPQHSPRSRQMEKDPDGDNPEGPRSERSPGSREI
jgi:hypothetical protein